MFESHLDQTHRHMPQAFVGVERARKCFRDPVFPDDEGLNLLPYEGGCLTYEGEINKMAVNVAFGRYGMKERAYDEH